MLCLILYHTFSRMRGRLVLLVLFFELKAVSFNFIMLVFFYRQTSGINESFLTPPRSTAIETPLRVTTDISLLFFKTFLFFDVVRFLLLSVCLYQGTIIFRFLVVVAFCVCVHFQFCF